MTHQKTDPHEHGSSPVYNYNLGACIPTPLHVFQSPTETLSVVDQDPHDAGVNTGTSDVFPKSVKAKYN
ncbi:hypothetical protein E2C01_043039 [Portunus trituberculatus]|uniref:Uncharacterized protein n=1 Tax=Portunus trituberculatus TaxID=210409 RepID=A0A5B7FRU9_PORTR|nr:hypothetical protein [Portunus trituberculatus]